MPRVSTLRSIRVNVPNLLGVVAIHSYCSSSRPNEGPAIVTRAFEVLLSIKLSSSREQDASRSSSMHMMFDKSDIEQLADAVYLTVRSDNPLETRKLS